ncbi:alpha/beta fold hydrolase [Microbacterium rhizophilus]|uniref:alpha/beta fold hydrolase n=1 Tax=Microbacterium rhizophilus TaxID=3138934 RepID=UPI0031E91526
MSDDAITFRSVTIRTSALEIAAQVAGPEGGSAAVLLHGFPYGPLSYEAVASRLAAAGMHVVVPYLRGFGPTRFRDDRIARSGQQAAIGRDAVELVEALDLDHPILVGYDWGGRAASVAGALRPDLIGGVVALGGYTIQDIAAAGEPGVPADERLAWYQYYFHGERGRAGLTRHRRALALQLWREWSPTREIDPAEFDRTAPAFDNPDFVDVVIHSYRHRYGLAEGAPEYAADEARLAALPPVAVPAMVLDPVDDPMIVPQGRAHHERHFADLRDHRLVPGGHNQPFDAPAEVAAAVLDLDHEVRGGVTRS